MATPDSSSTKSEGHSTKDGERRCRNSKWRRPESVGDLRLSRNQVDGERSRYTEDQFGFLSVENPFPSRLSNVGVASYLSSVDEGRRAGSLPGAVPPTGGPRVEYGYYPGDSGDGQHHRQRTRARAS